MKLTPFKKILIFIGTIQAILTVGLISLEILRVATDVLNAGTKRFMPQGAPVIYGVLTFANLVLAVGLFQRQLKLDERKKRQEMQELEKKFGKVFGKEGKELEEEIEKISKQYYQRDSEGSGEIEMSENTPLLTNKGN